MLKDGHFIKKDRWLRYLKDIFELLVLSRICVAYPSLAMCNMNLQLASLVIMTRGAGPQLQLS